MKQISVRVDDELYNKVFNYSEDEENSIQDFVKEALFQYMSDLKKKKEANKDHRFTFIDLFAGIGGMRLAFEKNGGKCVFTSEWDKYCQLTYFANFEEKPNGDIKQIRESDIPDHDILVAGFPCQPFSIAGVSKKNSLGRNTGFLDETQGTLFFDIVRILNRKRPKAFLLENVKNLRSHDKGKTWEIIRNALLSLNYEIFFEVLDGQDYVPQHRERIFIVGFDKQRYGEEIKFDFKLEKPKNKPKLKDILDEVSDDKYTLSDNLWSYLQEYAEKHKLKGNGFGYGLPDLENISRTLSARYYKDGSEILIKQKNKNPRRLTPRECSRLQGFPEDFIIPVSDTQAYKQFGNSVVVPLVTEVASVLIYTIEKLDEKNDIYFESNAI